MNYKLSDLIEKLINIKKNSLELYAEIQKNTKGQSNKALDIVVEAIKKQELKHIEYYEDLKRKVESSMNDDIDFYLYDKIIKLIFEFKSKDMYFKIDSVQELIKFAVGFEEDNIALLINIKGRLIERKEDVNKSTYKIIEKIIEEEEDHKKMFEKLIILKN